MEREWLIIEQIERDPIVLQYLPYVPSTVIGCVRIGDQIAYDGYKLTLSTQHKDVGLIAIPTSTQLPTETTTEGAVKTLRCVLELLQSLAEHIVGKLRQEAGRFCGISPHLYSEMVTLENNTYEFMIRNYTMSVSDIKTEINVGGATTL